MNTISKLASVTCLTLAATAVHAQPGTVFNQMLHIPIGNARLAVSPDGEFLRARQLGPAGEDGFRTQLPAHATAWKGKFIVQLDDGDFMRFDPISEGTAIAPLEVTANATGLSALVEFTSSNQPDYRIEVRKHGEIVAVWDCRPGFDCVPPDDPEPPTDPGPGPGGGVIIVFEPLPDPEVDEPTLFEERFKQDRSGNCVHIVRTTDDTAISVGGIPLGVGDEVVITEQARGRQGRYPYAGFDGMEVRSSAPQIVFVDEASR